MPEPEATTFMLMRGTMLKANFAEIDHVLDQLAVPGAKISLHKNNGATPKSTTLDFLSAKMASNLNSLAFKPYKTLSTLKLLRTAQLTWHV